MSARWLRVPGLRSRHAEETEMSTAGLDAPIWQTWLWGDPWADFLLTANPAASMAPVAQTVPAAQTVPVAEPDPVADPGTIAEAGAAEVEPCVQGELRDLITEAPKVGRVRPAPTPMLKAATALRTPSVIMDGLRCGDFHLAAASQAGQSHLLGGMPRQDGYDFVVTTTGSLVVAVADGLGSRAYSQLGARLFGEHVVQLGLEHPDWTAAQFLTEAAERVGAYATAHYGVTARDVGFVAAVAVFDRERCTIARVGDVSAFAHADGDEFGELFADDGGSMNMLSVSLPGAATPEVVTTGATRVVVTTDGMAGDIRHSPGVRNWLADRWVAPLTAHAMNDTLRFRRQGSHDDRTAVVVWRSTQPEATA